MRNDQAIDCCLQRLYDLGFRRMVVNGLSPLGCLPMEITTRNPKDESRSCVEALNFVSAQYNTKLQAQLGRWTAEGVDGAKVAYGDTYNPFVELLTYPEKYGCTLLCTIKVPSEAQLVEAYLQFALYYALLTRQASEIEGQGEKEMLEKEKAARFISDDEHWTGLLAGTRALLSEQVSQPMPRKMASQRGVATTSFVAVTVMALVASELAALVKAELVNDSWLRARLRRANVSCLLVFGDSSVDPGNNNVLNTTFKSNFLPYGINFAGHRPTGRFSNGRLTTDFIAEALGLGDAIPAFLQHNLTKQEFLHGFSFASAASGYDDLTANLHLRRVVGETRAQQVIKNSIAVLSSGTNDFIENYFLNPDRRKQFSVDQYTDFLVECMATDIQEIHRLGGERFAVVAVPPLGCMPLVRALYGRSKCVAEINEVVMEFNSKVKAKLATVDQWLSDHVRGAFVDAYTVLLRAVESPTRYGFSESSKGCCGSGVMEFGTTCRGLSTCSQPSKYVFWDAVHPTESMYRVIAIEAIKEVYKILL
ncbi:GDSL esterase/lipase [Nymphaea thermarum]|nr:GDSL esterase/lipase [Nymphaea thermarum]